MSGLRMLPALKAFIAPSQTQQDIVIDAVIEPLQRAS
jgi:hypothetical protein